MTKNQIPIFLVCGKSPFVSKGGGYAAFALILARVLNSVGRTVYLVTSGRRNKEEKTDFGYLIERKFLFFDTEQTALPWLLPYSAVFALSIHQVAIKKAFPKYIVWGIGPWGLAGSILKVLYPRKVISVNNYFTSISHEWRGALQGAVYKDYGLLVRLKYLCIYYVFVPFYSVIEKFILKKNDRIVVNYQSTIDILTEEFQIPKTKFFKTRFIIKIYSRTKNEKQFSIKLPKQYLLLVSRQDARKGINFLLRAMQLLIKKGMRTPLLIAGAGPMMEANMKLAKKLGVGKQVHFLGFVPNLKSLLKPGAIFCFPTIEEGAGALIINEMMSAGIPIITTNCDGIKEDLNDKKSALLVPPADPQALAESISFLIKSPKYAEKLAKTAKIEYKEKFNSVTVASDLEKLLNKLL